MTDNKKSTKYISMENPDYIANKDSWKLVRDLIKGERALKDHDLKNIKSLTLSANQAYKTQLTGLTYLPYTSSSTEQGDITRYVTYVQRASLFNATRKTEAGMSGMVYGKASIMDLPTSIEYLTVNADGSGVGLVSQSVEVLNDVLEVGRCGLFVDFPIVDQELSQEDVDELQLRSNIIKYKAEDIVDWGTVCYGATEKLNYVKLAESEIKRNPDNIFETVCIYKYRVLLINELGFYEQRIYESDDEYETFIPTDFSGEPLTFIPFYFIGAIDNRPDCDIAPLLEIAELNIKHYRNSADYEESTFLVGQPTVAMTGLSQQWIDDNYPDGLMFGSRQVIMLPPGGSMDIKQADPNNMAMEGMKQKQEQLKALGARLITDGGAAETAEAARIKHASDISVLKTVVKNISDGYNSAILAVQLYNGSVEDFRFAINNNFYSDKLSIDEIIKLVGLLQTGIITEEEFQIKLKESGLSV